MNREVVIGLGFSALLGAGLWLALVFDMPAPAPSPDLAPMISRLVRRA